MKKKLTKLIVSVLTSALVLTSLPANKLFVRAEQEVVKSVSENDMIAEEIQEVNTAEVTLPDYRTISGTFGDNQGFHYSYDESTATMTVTGEGSGLPRITSYIPTGAKNIIFQDCIVSGSMSELLPTDSSIECVIFRNCDTSNVTDMSDMFSYCSRLRSVDISGLDTGNVTDMSDMFQGCSSLSSVDISGLDTGNVTDMSSMFQGCSSLSSVDVSGFNTENVTNMMDMFWDCENLEQLDVSSFNTSKVTTMANMFCGCYSLESLNVSGFDTSNVKNMSDMFHNCSSLTELDVSKFNTSKVVNMFRMFSGCESLQDLNVGNFNTGNVTDMYGMFEVCSNLVSLDLSGFNTSKVTNMHSMFMDCSSLKSVDISGFDTSNVTDLTYMFISAGIIDIIRTPKKMGAEQIIPVYRYYYDSAWNKVLSITADYCGQTLIRYKPESGSEVPNNKYLIRVIDSNGNAISGAEVTYDGQTAVTNANGEVTFGLIAAGNFVITVSKQGYITWSNANSNYVAESSRYETIVLYSEAEGTSKLRVAYYKSTGPLKYNLLTQTKTLNLKNTGNYIGDLTKGDFSLSCEALDTTNVKEYQLWQNERKIATSASGFFSLNVEQGFVEGGKCFVRVVSKNGKEVDTSINLTFALNTINETSSVSLMNKSISFTVKDSVPYLGGSTVNVALPKLPVDVMVTDEKLYVGFNANLYDSGDDGKTYIEDVKDSISKAMKAGKTSLGKKTNKEIQKLMKEKKKFKLPGGEYTASVIGYAEGDVGSTTVKGELYMFISAESPTFGFDTWVVVVPVTVQVKGKIEAKFGGVISYNWTTGVLDGGLNLNIVVGLDAFGGIGVKKAVGVGTYGSAEVDLDTRLLGTNSGVRKVDLTGELGVKAYFAIWSYQKPFAHNTWHLYTANTVSTTALEESVDLELYNAQKYEVESLDYLKEETPWNGNNILLCNMSESNADANTNLISLLEGTYRNAQPVMVETDNALYAAFLRADADTGEVYVACTKMVDGVWSTPVRADTSAVLDDAPQLLVDEEGNIWMAYARTERNADTSMLLGYAQNQSIVIGTVDPETLVFTEIKEYASTGYAHMQQLAQVDGVPTLAWLDSMVTDDNSVFGSAANTVKNSIYKNETWSDASCVCEVPYLVQEMVIGDTGIGCSVDRDNDLSTTEDRTLLCYDWQGVETVSVAGITGNISYGVLPGETKATFLWNDSDMLCSVDGSVTVPGITNEYVVNGNSIYYSAAVDGGAELAVLRMNSDGSFGEPILLTESGRYLENLSVATIYGTDIVFALNTEVEITENSVTPDKNLVWAIVQPVNDIRIDAVDYDAGSTIPGESVPVTLTVANVGEYEVSEISVRVNGTLVVTERVNLLAGQSTDIVVNLDCPKTLTEYTVQVEDSSNGLEADYTQENNSTTFKLGYASLSVDAKLQQVGKSRTILAEVMNKGIDTASGTVMMYDQSGQLLGMNSFTNLGSENMILIEMPLFSSVNENTLNVVVTTAAEELHTYDNSDTVYLPGEKAVSYNIAYELNGGIQNENNPQTYTSNDVDIELAEPSREGYRFEGWFSDADFAECVEIIPAGSAGDIMLYARWTATQYNITYHLDGGTNSNSNPNCYTIDTDNIVLQSPQRTGHTFAGWYSDSALTTKVTTIEKGNAGDVSLYAKWTVNKYNIAYHKNGGTGMMATDTGRIYGRTYSLKVNVYKRVGYVFNGWNTKSDGTGKAFADKAGVENLSIANGKTVTLYAQWKKVTYKLTYKLNGGINSSKNPTAYDVNTASFGLNAPTKKGYTFKGWYEDAKFTQKVTKIAKGSAGNMTLYAQWQANKYVIKFNANGGKGNMKDMNNRLYGKSYNLKSNTFKRTGYTFNGWNTKKNGRGNSYKNMASVKNLVTSNGKSITLYAQWKEVTYKITYKLNGGKNNSNNPKTYTVTSATKKLKNPTRVGYTFKGWYSNAKLTKKVTKISKGSTGNKTLYAKWVKK